MHENIIRSYPRTMAPTVDDGIGDLHVPLCTAIGVGRGVERKAARVRASASCVRRSTASNHVVVTARSSEESGQAGAIRWSIPAISTSRWLCQGLLEAVGDRVLWRSIYRGFRMSAHHLPRPERDCGSPARTSTDPQTVKSHQCHGRKRVKIRSFLLVAQTATAPHHGSKSLSTNQWLAEM